MTTMKKEMISSFQGIYSSLSNLLVYELVGNFVVLGFQVLQVLDFPVKTSSRTKGDKVE